MKLSYRGSQYDLSFGIQISDSEMVGKYRGSDVRFKQPKPSEIPDAVVPMQYRGTRYLGLK